MGWPNGKILAIRVQDVVRQIWFNWDDPPRNWTTSPPSTNNGNAVYVAFWAINDSSEWGELLLELKNRDTGQVLASVLQMAAPGEGVGLEWSGLASDSNINLSCIVTDYYSPYS